MSIVTKLLSVSTVFLFLSFCVGSTHAQSEREMSENRLHLATGWYCGAADSFFDNDGERQDWGGFKESQGMFFVQGRYDFASLNAGNREIELTGLARISIDRVKQSFDGNKGSGSDSRTGSGLGVITLGVSGKTSVNDYLNFGLGFDAFLDVASDPDFESGDIPITDGSHAVGINGRLKYHNEKVYGGVKVGHVNRTEENFRSTNYAAVSGGYEVWSNEKVSVSVGAGFSYHADTDDGGKLYGVSPIVKASVPRHDLKFKIGPGCTEDYTPSGLYQIGGESAADINALGITVSKSF
ncbi:MAG: hypothetical protein HKN43_00255 [Rhodothermales bacterium]|nr:hypothetical protein [Rhodothermales bacterium]